MQKNSLFVQISVFLIRELHQKGLSPMLKRRGVICRFHPSCSNYGVQALEKYGFIKGWKKTLHRINRCKPDNYSSCVDYP